ncbi:hypothetical protein L7F22_039698 [Adiantum nelumboides]|nr:hypothetical protein [Adiantum nelumboides]
MAVASLFRTWEERRLLGVSNAINTQTLPLSLRHVASLLIDCAKSKDLQHVQCVHFAIIECKHDWTAKLACFFIHIYGSHGCLYDAESVFHALHEHTTNTWDSIISIYANHGHPERAILFYGRMRCSTIKSKKCTFITALKSCASIKALAEGRFIHSDLMKQDFELDLWSGNTLIDMYCKCNNLDDARKTLEDMRTRTVVSWNSLLSGYVQVEHIEGAAEILERMRQDGIEPSYWTLFCQLKICASSKDLDQGKKIHNQVYMRGLKDTFIDNVLLNMYAKCNKLNDAHAIFCNLHEQNVVAWSVMIHGYAESGHSEDALKMYVNMRNKGIKPDEVTFGCVLKACAIIQALEEGRLIHIDALKCDSASGIVMRSILIFMYIKCGSIVDARRVFDMLAIQDVVSWSSIIEGYTENGQGDEALQLFKDMHKAGVEPNIITFISSIKACTSIGAIDQGEIIHMDVIEQGFDSNLVIGNALIDMYGKGGCLEDSVRVFDSFMTHSVESWSALLAGFANYGDSRLANHYFQAMCKTGLEPDFISFLSLLYACSHAGLFEEAQFHLKCMVEDCKIAPTREHFACMVDMFGRAGFLEGAGIVVLAMPFPPDTILWKALLSSCVRHNDMRIGRHAFECLLNCDCKTAAGYVLMSNIYVANIIEEDG